MTLSMWQTRGTGLPTLSGRESLDDGGPEAFAAAVARLLATVGEGASPFQIVAQVGDSSRGVQLRGEWPTDRVAAELWAGYRGLRTAVG